MWTYEYIKISETESKEKTLKWTAPIITAPNLFVFRILNILI